MVIDLTGGREVVQTRTRERLLPDGSKPGSMYRQLHVYVVLTGTVVHSNVSQQQRSITNVVLFPKRIYLDVSNILINNCTVITELGQITVTFFF